MLIMGVLCLVAAVVSLVFGVRTLARPLTGDPEQLVLRAVAPAQVAVGVILAVGGTLVLAGPPAVALLALIISVTGALGILAAGAWQGARFAARQSALAAPAGCGAGCGCSDSTPAEPAGCGAGCGCSDSAPVEPAGCGSGCGCGDSATPEPEPEPASGCGSGCGCA